MHFIEKQPYTLMITRQGAFVQRGDGCFSQATSSICQTSTQDWDKRCQLRTTVNNVIKADTKLPQGMTRAERGLKYTFQLLRVHLQS